MIRVYFEALVGPWHTTSDRGHISCLRWARMIFLLQCVKHSSIIMSTLFGCSVFQGLLTGFALRLFLASKYEGWAPRAFHNPFWVKWYWKMILRHVALSCVNISLFWIIWIHFKLMSLIWSWFGSSLRLTLKTGMGQIQVGLLACVTKVSMKQVLGQGQDGKADAWPRTRQVLDKHKDQAGWLEHSKTWTCPKYEDTTDKHPKHVFICLTRSIMNVPILMWEHFHPILIHKFDPKQHNLNTNNIFTYLSGPDLTHMQTVKVKRKNASESSPLGYPWAQDQLYGLCHPLSLHDTSVWPQTGWIGPIGLPRKIGAPGGCGPFGRISTSSP